MTTVYDQKVKDRARKVQELIQAWENFLKAADLDSASRCALEIENLGKELMKMVWETVQPGENLSDVIARILEED